MKNQNFKLLLACLVALFFFQNLEKTLGQTSIESIKNGQYGTPETRARQQDSLMNLGLKLTPEQIPKVQEINLRYAQESEQKVAQAKISDWTKCRRIMAIQNRKDAELKAVLSPEQFRKYSQKRDELFWQGVRKHKDFDLKLMFPLCLCGKITARQHLLD